MGAGSIKNEKILNPDQQNLKLLTTWWVCLTSSQCLRQWPARLVPEPSWKEVQPSWRLYCGCSVLELYPPKSRQFPGGSAFMGLLLCRLTDDRDYFCFQGEHLQQRKTILPMPSFLLTVVVITLHSGSGTKLLVSRGITRYPPISQPGPWACWEHHTWSSSVPLIAAHRCCPAVLARGDPGPETAVRGSRSTGSTVCRLPRPSLLDRGGALARPGFSKSHPISVDCEASYP